jgi:hypothetical protein
MPSQFENHSTKLKVISDITKNVKFKHIFENIPFKSDKCAVLIEPRKQEAIEYVFRIFVFHLAPRGWSFQIFHGPSSEEFVKEMTRGMNVTLTNLGVDNLGYPDEYSYLCLSKSLYEKVDAKHILLYQTDCLLLDGDLEDFLEYDYVGAPWDWDNSKKLVGNGGLSLRNKEAMIKVCEENIRRPSREHEDTYIAKCNFLKFPTVDKAKEFSVETIPYPHPKGVHQPWRHPSLNFYEKCITGIYNAL